MSKAFRDIQHLFVCSSQFNSHPLKKCFTPFPEDHLTVRELVDLAIQTWGVGTFEVAAEKNQHHEASLLKLDIKDALGLLGWTPKLKASEAIKWTMEWYKKETPKKAAYTFEQIDNYLSQ